MRRLLAVIAFALLAGCAGTPSLKTRAIGGQAGDIASTAIALSQPGTMEANPLGVALIPLKISFFSWAEKEPYPRRIYMHRLLSAYGWGATVSNFCTAAVAALAGPTAIFCLPLGIASGWWDWKDTEGTPKEQFDRLCEYARLEKPNLECVWSEP
jgi:hypothetical protein